ncbi:MAG: hypothetical protein LBD32_02705 [Cytophagales bacterium]|jgi:hypothetical protein|nr:hypothetical protein [Cytophagales bacterium]
MVGQLRDNKGRRDSILYILGQYQGPLGLQYLTWENCEKYDGDLKKVLSDEKKYDFPDPFYQSVVFYFQNLDLQSRYKMSRSFDNRIVCFSGKNFLVDITKEQTQKITDFWVNVSLVLLSNCDAFEFYCDEPNVTLYAFWENIFNKVKSANPKLNSFTLDKSDDYKKITLRKNN